MDVKLRRRNAIEDAQKISKCAFFCNYFGFMRLEVEKVQRLFSCRRMKGVVCIRGENCGNTGVVLRGRGVAGGKGKKEEG